MWLLRRWHVVGYVGLLVLGLDGPPAWCAPPSAYTVTDLGLSTVSSETGVIVFDLDEDGTVLGCTPSATRLCHSALLYPTKTFVAELPDLFFAADRIRQGIVVGQNYDLQGTPHAAAWSAASGVQDLGAVLAQSTTNAVCVVNPNTFVSVITLNGQSGPAIWDAGTWTFLPTTAPPDIPDFVQDCAPNGLVLADSSDGQQRHPRLWVMGLPTDLPIPADAQTITTRSVTSAGLVVGHGSDKANPLIRYGYQWTPGSGWSRVAPPAGEFALFFRSVNAAGTIVGDTLGRERPKAMRWTPEQGLEALTPLLTVPGWTLTQSVAVNTAGQILGYGLFNDQEHAVLLTPGTPAPPLTVRVQGDLDGDGHLDEAGLTADCGIWVSLGGAAWQQIPGCLTSLVIGKFFPDGKDHLAGLSGGWIWRSPSLGTWQWVPGFLTLLVAGDFDGDGIDDFAGLSWGNSIWIFRRQRTWQWIPGSLLTMHAEPAGPQDDLVGFNGQSCWRMHQIGVWTAEACGPQVAGLEPS